MEYMEVFRVFWEELARKGRITQEYGTQLRLECQLPCCKLKTPLSYVGRQEWEHYCGAVFSAATLTVQRPAMSKKSQWLRY